jgi:hypothetical protein
MVIGAINQRDAQWLAARSLARKCTGCRKPAKAAANDDNP